MPPTAPLLAEEIRKAIAAHGMWKSHLRSAITTGSSEYSPAIVCLDNQCDFGRWLHGLEPSQQRAPRCQKVRTLHAEFHREAARVLELAVKGHAREAQDATSFMSRFADISAKLTAEMMEWRRETA